MPKRGKDSHADYERYKSYYLAREASPAGVHKRAERERARRTLIREGRLTPHDPRQEDHVKPLAKGGSGSMKNVRVLSAKANRKKFDH